MKQRPWRKRTGGCVTSFTETLSTRYDIRNFQSFDLRRVRCPFNFRFRMCLSGEREWGKPVSVQMSPTLHLSVLRLFRGIGSIGRTRTLGITNDISFYNQNTVPFPTSLATHSNSGTHVLPRVPSIFLLREITFFEDGFPQIPEQRGPTTGELLRVLDLNSS